MDSKQKEQQQWHELYEKWSWVASQFFDEAVKDFNELKDANNKRAYFCLPPKIEEHLWRVWRATISQSFISSKMSEKYDKTTSVEKEFDIALYEEKSQFLEGGLSPEQVIKDSDKKDELKRNWHDFFYWGYDKRFVESLSKVFKVLAREEVKKSLDVLLWQGWDRAEVERAYLHAVTKEFSKDLIRLRYDMLGEEDLAIDTIYGGDDFSSEKRGVKIHVEKWFDEALEKFMKGKPSWILHATPTAGKDLYGFLINLWWVGFEKCFLKKELEQLRIKTNENEIEISFSPMPDGGGGFNNQKAEKRKFLGRYAKREREIKKALRQQTKDYPSFWMRRFSSFWKKSYSDELVKTVSDYFKEKIRKEEEFHLSLMSEVAREEKLKAGEVAAEEVKANEERKAGREKAKRRIALYKEVLARFEENWKKVQEMTRHDLGGWSYYLEKVAKVAVPILVLLTFLFGGGAVKHCNGNQATGDQNSGAHQIDKTANPPEVFL